MQALSLERELWLHDRANPLPPCRGELAVSLADLDRLGPPSWEDDPQNWPESLPPSPSRGWCFRANCGLNFMIVQDWIHHEFEGFDHACVLAASADELDHALMHLPFAARLFDRFGPALESEWEVCRFDDAGNRFLVGRYPSQASAACVAQQFEARGHKQSYFVEAVGARPAQVG